MIKLNQINTSDINSDTWIGANSLDLIAWAFFVTKTGNVVDKATAGSVISGVNNTQKTFAVDNETVALGKVEFVLASVEARYEVEIAGGTITNVDEWKFFNLTDADTVDGTTETTIESYVNTVDAGVAVDAVIKMQVKLVKFISATKGIFTIVL